MTLKHQLTKDYHRGKAVMVCRNSLIEYKYGITTTLEHLVYYKDRREWIVMKPVIKNYSYYLSAGYCSGKCLDGEIDRLIGGRR